MKNLFLRFSITLALLGWATNAIGQSFSSMYQFINVTTTSGTTDPTAVPTATGLTFGSFSSAGVGTNPNAGGVFSFTGWTTGATTGSDTFTGSIDLTDYYSVTLTPNVGCSIDINSLVFSSRRSTTGPRQFVVRSSLDSYATNLPATGGTNVTVVPTNVFQMPDGSATTTYPNNTVTLGTSFDAITSAITFRVYAFNAEASGGSFGIDDFQINGVASCGPTCSITNIALSDIQPCNDNFTPAPTTSDDFYTADITVTFANQPATGDLELSSSSNDLTQGTVVVPVSSLSGTTYTFDNVEIYADGAVSSITAKFTDLTTCTFTLNNIAAVNSCSASNCSITAINLSNMSMCNDNGTPANPADDYYTADVMVIYASPANTGTLNLSGDATASVGIASLNAPTFHTFTAVQLPADGTANTLTATFSAISTCTFTNSSITAVSSCSLAPACDISAISLSNTGVCNDNGTPNNNTDDYYVTDVVVTFANAPATGNLVLSGAASSTVAVGSLGSSTSHTFSGIQLPANGLIQTLTATFSAASPACTNTNSSIAAVSACSTPLPCSITDIALSNQSACNNNGTPLNPADDYYTADVTVTFANAPFSGSLNLTGDGTASVAVGSLGSSTSHTFVGVQLPTNGATGFNSLTATFSANTSCTFTKSDLVSINNCPTCSISSIALSNVSACNNGGTSGNAADDIYTADVTVNYLNAPTTGTLDLSGDATASIAVGSIGTTSYTFTGVSLPADGTLNSLTAAFSATPACTLTNASIAAVNSCSSAPSFALTACGASVSENFNTFAGTAASLMLGWTSNSIDYGPGGYYTNTGTYVASNSTYALGDATDANYGVKLPTTGQTTEDLSYCVTNNTGSAITSMNVAWNVEQYSVGQRPSTVDFFYSLDGTTYTQANITGTSLTAASTAGTSANLATVAVTPRSIVINSLSVANGATFCFRFRFNNGSGSGSNAHIGVDDLVVTPNCTAPCSISAIALSNIGACNDNGTPNNLTDDYYTADVTVTYANAPTTGNLVLGGNATATVAVGSLNSSTSHTFTAVQIPANGSSTTISATFSANSFCTFTQSAIAAVNPCSTPSVCAITNITVTAGSCNNNSTTGTATDDYYLADVTVTYTNPETVGTLDLSGDATASIAVGSVGATSYTFTGVQLPADGTVNTLTATFSNNASCTFTKNNITAVNSCSVPPANILLTTCNTTSSAETFNTYTGSAATLPTGWTVTSSLLQSGTYSNGGTLGVTNGVFALSDAATSETAIGAKVAANSGTPTGTGLAQFEYCTTNQTGNTLTGITFAWDAEQYSQGSRPTILDAEYKVGAGGYAALAGSTYNATTNATNANLNPAVVTPYNIPVTGISVASGDQVCIRYSIKTAAGSGNNAHLGLDNVTMTPLCCEITDVQVSNIVCNSNGTIPDGTDDYYTADVTVTFANAPATGNLVLSGDATATEATTNLDAATSHTFVGIQLPADGTTSTLTATFDASATCTYTNSNIAAVSSCSAPVCSISAVSIVPISGSYNQNGTPNDLTDDYYLANITVSYNNIPTTGTLDLSGSLLNAPTVPANVLFIGASNYVFSNVQLKPGTGSLTATFSADPACTSTVAEPATQPQAPACPANFGTFPGNHN